MSRLPDIPDPEAFYGRLRKPGQWVNAINEIAREHGLAGPFSQSTDGSTVVFLSDQHCIKLHPPLPGFLASHQREVAALRCILGRLTIPTPELVADGELGAWKYFVSTRLSGRPIDAIWNDLDTEVRLRLATELGRAIQGLHQLDSDRVGQVTEPWAAFRRSQRARCLDLEEGKGLPSARLLELESYLSRLDQLGEPSTTSSLLHTEIGPSHVLVDKGRITGLIDFGDAMVGDPEYDLAPVGMFVTRGDSAAFRAFCLAYGLDEDELANPDRPARLLRHAVLHRYGTLAWYLETLAPPSGSLDDLAAHWFGVD